MKPESTTLTLRSSHRYANFGVDEACEALVVGVQPQDAVPRPDRSRERRAGAADQPPCAGTRPDVPAVTAHRQDLGGGATAAGRACTLKGWHALSLARRAGGDRSEEHTSELQSHVK